MAVFFWGTARAQEQSLPEHELKSGLIFQFARYVEWPTDFRPEERGPLVFAVLGDNAMFTALEAMVKGKKIKDRFVEIRRYSEGDLRFWKNETNACHLLFIGKSYESDLAKVLHALAGLSVLTVADTPGFAEQGVMFNLKTKTQRRGDRTVGFEINVQAAERARLKVSPKLWHLGEKVKTRERE